MRMTDKQIEKIKMSNQKEWRQRHALKRRQDPRHRQVENISRAVRGIIKNGTSYSKYEDYLGCSCEKFRQYIKMLCFLKGLDYNNYCYRTWHLDHVVPIKNFDLRDPKLLDHNFDQRLRELFYFSNYQPLERWENMSKFTKV